MRVNVLFAGIALSAVSLASLPAVAQADDSSNGGYDVVPWTSENTNTYTLSAPVPRYLTEPLRFTVQADGPTPVCAMELGEQIVTSAPFDFTLTPEQAGLYGDTVITVADCQDDLIAQIALNTITPFSIDSTVIQPGTDPTVEVTSYMDVPATVTVRQGSTVVSEHSMPADSSIPLRLPTERLKTTTTFTVDTVGQDGTRMTFPVVAAHGWNTGSRWTRIYQPCQTIVWHHDSTGIPSGVRKAKMDKDIRGALARLSQQTSLTFTETQNPDEATLTFSWENMGKRGPAALGGYSGDVGVVEFNSKNYWPTDKYAGFKPFKPYTTGNVRHVSGPAGRGWLIIHETMHSLGFGHIKDKKSVMYPVNNGQAGFTKDDRDGLAALYPATCSA